MNRLLEGKEFFTTVLTQISPHEEFNTHNLPAIFTVQKIGMRII